MNRSLSTYAKITLVFFAVLFTAVLIHPDVDLLDVHDVKISGGHSQFRSLDWQVAPQPLVLGGEMARPPRLDSLQELLKAAISSEQGSSSILRI